MKSPRNRLYKLAFLLIIVGLVSFSNHTTVGYIVATLGFAVLIFLTIFKSKKSKEQTSL